MRLLKVLVSIKKILLLTIKNKVYTIDTVFIYEYLYSY